MNNAYRPRRTCLSVPGSSRKMIDKAKGLCADEVFLDLEDAVAPEAKSQPAGKWRPRWRSRGGRTTAGREGKRLEHSLDTRRCDRGGRGGRGDNST